jgi:hemerythrin
VKGLTTMAFVNWNPNLSVKVDEMDNQHKELVDLLNQLHDAMKTGKGKDVVAKILSALANYTKVHFGAEEQYMRSIAYPELEIQKRAHKVFIDQIAEYETKLKAGENLHLNQVLNFLWNWLSTHIQKEDKKYGEYATKRTGTPVATR